MGPEMLIQQIASVLGIDVGVMSLIVLLSSISISILKLKLSANKTRFRKLRPAVPFVWSVILGGLMYWGAWALFTKTIVVGTLGSIGLYELLKVFSSNPELANAAGSVTTFNKEESK